MIKSVRFCEHKAEPTEIKDSQMSDSGDHVGLHKHGYPIYLPERAMSEQAVICYDYERQRTHETRLQKEEKNMRKRSLNLTLAVFALFMLSFFLQPEKAEAAGVTELTIGNEDMLTDADHTIQCGGGTAVYDPAADTLTLNNATIDCTFGQADSTIGAVEFRGSLKLVLNGENKITCDSSGILGDDGDLYISGEGSLDIQCSVSGISQGAGGSITIDDTNLTLNVKQGGIFLGSGIHAEGILTIQNGAWVNASADDIVLNGNGGVSITSGSRVTAQLLEGDGNHAILSSNTISISNAEVKAAGLSTSGYPIVWAGMTPQGKIIISDGGYVEINNPAGAGLYAYNNGDIRISDSTVTGTVYGTGLEAERDIRISDSTIDIVSQRSSAIYNTTGSVQIDGSSDVETTGRPAIKGALTVTPPDGGLIDIWAGDSEEEAEKTEESPLSESAAVKCNTAYFRSAPHMHVFEAEIVSDAYKAGDATCEEPARYYKSCECGAAGTDTFSHGEPSGHDTEVKNAKTVTCTEEGYTGDEICKVCGKVIVQGKTVPVLAHSYSDGKCTVCGAADPDYKPEDTADDEKDDGTAVRPQSGALPQTGVSDNLIFWITLLLISGVGVAGTVVIQKKK